MNLFTIPRSAVLTTLAALFSVGCDNFTMVIEGEKRSEPAAEEEFDTAAPTDEELEETDEPEGETDEEETDEPEDTDDEETGDSAESEDSAVDEPEDTDDEEARDSDRDGLTDAEENELGTEKYDSDTDGDGYSDGEEVEAGSNPLDEESIPAAGDTGSADTDTGTPEADDTGTEEDSTPDTGSVESDTGDSADEEDTTTDTGEEDTGDTGAPEDTDTAEDTETETEEEPPCFDCVVITVTPSATRSSASVGYEVDEACEDFGDWWDTTSATASVSDDGADWSFTVEEVYDDYVGRYSLEYSSTRYSCMGSSLDGDHSAVYYDASGSSCDLEIIEISTGSGCEAQFVASCSTEPVCTL